MKVTINVDGIERVFKGDFDTLYNNEWDDILRDMVDSAKEYERIS
jgi:hypothetical protein